MSDRVYEGADVIDSRDVIKKIRELTEERDELKDALDSAETDDVRKEAHSALETWTDEYGAELADLEALAEEASGSPDWEHGEALIADHYFVEYAQQLAEDIGAINRDASWPNDHIDWDAAAEALQQDYFSVEFGSTTYWIRS